MDIAALRPADTPEYMTPAWLGCLSFALGDADIVAQFRADTGLTWTPGRTPLDRLIDATTGADEQFLEAFIRWTNVHVWGPVDLSDATGVAR